MTEDQKVATGVAVALAFMSSLLGLLEIEVLAFAMGVALIVDVTLGLTVALRARI